MRLPKGEWSPVRDVPNSVPYAGITLDQVQWVGTLSTSQPFGTPTNFAGFEIGPK